MSAQPQYRVTVVGPDGELLAVLSLDGYDLSNTVAQRAIGSEVAIGMGSMHRERCAQLEEVDDD